MVPSMLCSSLIGSRFVTFLLTSATDITATDTTTTSTNARLSPAMAPAESDCEGSSGIEKVCILFVIMTPVWKKRALYFTPAGILSPYLTLSV